MGIGFTHLWSRLPQDFRLLRWLVSRLNLVLLCLVHNFNELSPTNNPSWPLLTFGCQANLSNLDQLLLVENFLSDTFSLEILLSKRLKPRFHHFNQFFDFGESPHFRIGIKPMSPTNHVGAFSLSYLKIFYRYCKLSIKYEPLNLALDYFFWLIRESNSCLSCCVSRYSATELISHIYLGKF